MTHFRHNQPAVNNHDWIVILKIAQIEKCLTPEEKVPARLIRWHLAVGYIREIHGEGLDMSASQTAADPTASSV